MNKSVDTFCDGLDCPIRDLCARFVDIPKSGRGYRLISFYAETPGRLFDVSGKKRWICDKKIDHE